MSILTKIPILSMLWSLLGTAIKAEGEVIVEAQLARHASLADLDELERVVAAARQLKAGQSHDA
jgi:hypothetical protein